MLIDQTMAVLILELKPVGYDSFAGKWLQDYIADKVLRRDVAREHMPFIFQAEGLNTTMAIIAKLMQKTDHMCACEDMAMQAQCETKNVLSHVFM